jgi:hypothetical protein
VHALAGRCVEPRWLRLAEGRLTTVGGEQLPIELLLLGL